VKLGLRPVLRHSRDNITTRLSEFAEFI